MTGKGRKRFIRAAASGLLVMPVYCGAASPLDGWYGGIALGQSTVNMKASDWDDGTLTGNKLDKSGFAYKVIAGYHFYPWLSLELDYSKMALVHFSAVEPGVTPSIWEPGPVKGEAEVDGVGLGLVFTQTVWNHLSLFARGGVLFWDSTTLKKPTISGGTLALGNEIKINDDGVGWSFGAGADVRVHGDWHVRLEWNHSIVNFNSTLERSVDFPSVGVTLDF